MSWFTKHEEGEILCLLRKIDAKVDTLTDAIRFLKGETTTMSAEVDRLTADVAAQETVSQSIVTVIQNLAAEVRNNAGDPAALMALADRMEKNTAVLAAAVVQGTPAAGDGSGGTTGTGTGTGTTGSTGTTGDTGTGNTGTTGTVDTTSGTGTVANPAPTTGSTSGTDASGPTVPNPNPNA